MASRSRRRLTRRGAAPLSAEATGARELRALLPRVWRHFRSAAPGGRSRRRRRRIADAASADAEGDGAASADASSSGHRERSAGVSDEVVTTTVQGLQEWLGRLSGPRSKRSLCGATRADILRAATAAAQLPPLRQRLGFRFRDPSKSGSWGMENLVGFTRQPVRALRGPASCEDSLVSWSSYMASYGLRVASEGSRIEVFRAVRLDSVSCRVEKRRRGNPDGPLTTGRFTVTARSRCDEAGDKRKRIRIVRAPLDLLPAVIVRPPSGPHQWTLVYLHGMGETAFGNYSDRPHYFLDGSIALKVIAPTSPQRELSCFDKWWQQVGSSAQGSKSKPKWRLAKFSAWYDYLENSGGLREDPIDWHSLYAVRTALHGLLRHEAAQLGGRFDRIILGGKSQGCTVALDAALTFPTPLGGFIGVVGHLLSCTPVEPDGPQASTPLHFFHEPQDDIMRWSWVSACERRLREAGYCLRSRRLPDPENHGHYVEGVEGAWVRSALRLICEPDQL